MVVKTRGILPLTFFWILLKLAYSENNQLRDVVIRVAGYNSLPSMIIETSSDGNFSYSGFNKDIIDVLFKYLDLRYEFVNINKSEILSKGLGEALLNQLRRNEVDFNCFGFIPTVERAREFDFTVPVYSDPYRFLVKYPEEESRLWAPLRPFQSPVWVLFLVAIAAIIFSLSGLMLLVKELEPRTEEQTKFMELVAGNALYICTIIAGQAEWIRERKLAVRILVAVWCLMALILINSYTGNLTGYLTVPKLNPVVNSLEELAYKRRTGLVLEAKYILTEKILNAKAGLYKEIGDAMRANPHLIINNPDDAGPTLMKYDVPWLTTNYIVRYCIGLHVKKPKCRFTQSKLLPLSQLFSAVIRKDLPYSALIQSKLHYMLENGLIEKLRQNYSPRIDKCLISNKIQKPKTKPLKLIDYSSAFVLLGLGLGLASLTFFFEIISHYFFGSRNQQF